MTGSCRAMAAATPSEIVDGRFISLPAARDDLKKYYNLFLREAPPFVLKILHLITSGANFF
jgi:hypothetical protein